MFRAVHFQRAVSLLPWDKMIENKYLKFCDPDIPLHYMTIWTARAYLAKYHLMEHHARYSSNQTDAQRDTAISYAHRLLECDTKLRTSSLTKGFLWMAQSNFPLPAYLQIVHDLRRRPISGHADRSWAVMNDNYNAQFGFDHVDASPLFQLFAKLVFQAWEAHEQAFRQSKKSLTTPRFVSTIREISAKIATSSQKDDARQPNNVVDVGVDNSPMPMPVDIGGHTYGLEEGFGYRDMYLGFHPHIPDKLNRSLM